MAQSKINFDQFIQAVDMKNKSFVQDLHKYLMDNGCKAAFEEKKSGYHHVVLHDKLRGNAFLLRFFLDERFHLH